MVKPSAERLGIAHTGMCAVRIAFESAESIEIACSGFVGEPWRSIQRPSQPVDLTPVVWPENQMSELSKWLSEYLIASTAGSTASSEPSPPSPLP